MDDRVTSAGALARTVLDRPAGLGRVRLVCIDGPAGSGKTTFAAILAAGIGVESSGSLEVATVHLDDLYEGWSGLDPGLTRRLEAQLLDPLARGRPARFQRFDWDRGAFGAWRQVPVPDVLLVEGCGSGRRAVAARASLLVWVEVPADVRLARGLARDGDHMRDEWLRWMGLEQVEFAREGTRARADAVVDGAVGLDP